MKRIIYILLIFLLFSSLSCEHQSGRKRGSNTNSIEIPTHHHANTDKKGKTIVKMKNQNGVYYVPCRINGNEMEFIFDTGASDITMSLTEALFLYKQGKLTDNDFIGIQEYQIADGSISEGTIVVLRSVEIGNRKLKDVRASIIHNMTAPLLLGQSALARFGKISIDYNNQEIVFE
jgi:aspartyl protease family protein